MPNAILEHVNITVSDPKRTAEMLCKLFDWKVRWRGDAIHGGESYHVGEENSYIAIYAGKTVNTPKDNNYETVGGLNHVAVVVDDLVAIEAHVREAGYTPHSHADYEPGKRFYFQDHDGIEFEVVSYG